jgi:hypothetical protein
MIVVIQCAAIKRPNAGYVLTSDGRRVCFVANPSLAPPGDVIYARPDDPSDIGATWRELLLQYNQSSAANPLRLARAFELYENAVYRRLAARVGIDNLYILSAGWGLIAASFLTRSMTSPLVHWPMNISAAGNRMPTAISACWLRAPLSRLSSSAARSTHRFSVR